MPEKITSKNLSYNSSLPPFLQRLHAQAGGATGPNPILAAQKRSVKKRSSSEEAEDAPLVVDEHGDSVDVQFEKDGTIREVERKADPAESDDEHDESAIKSNATTVKTVAEKASSMGARKRKIGKVIGQDSSEAGAKTEDVQDRSSADRKDKAQVDKKGKKKAATKKIKLSFQEDEA
ncbi:hypothetical protein E4U13_007438 [Claviceps humidiphila]|uniref:DUF4604 domain-containing protein n=1 Tax=Claviceps humidiphila TaxID=1294629 RepID=A0A9P7Q6P3_9HYPO|nr:hypothetical protein E4U13_007438 [Claviceps humidiphila]